LEKFIRRYFFSDEIPLDVRILNMVCCFGFMASFIATCARIVERMSMAAIAVMAVLMALIAAFFATVNRLDFYRFGTRVTLCTLFVVGDILFPLMFFTNGGMDSGMSAYFVLSVVLIFLLAKGAARKIMLLAHIAVIVSIYAVIFFFGTAIQLNPLQRLVDHIQSILVSGFFIGFVIIFQNRMYLIEKEKADAAIIEIAKQDELLHVVHVVATMLLTSEAGQFDEMLRGSMEILACSVSADRVYIWSNFTRDGKLHYRQETAWLDASAPRPDASVGGISFPYIESIPEWEEKFASEGVVNGPLSALSEVERERLAPYGIVSILVIPLFLQNVFWGFVSFDDCREEREFSDDEANILRSGSLLMANALARKEMTDTLVKAREDALSSAQAKSDFLANMSHEIRTPLNAVIGMTSIGRIATDIERKDYCFGKIDDASTHLLGVINDILDMSKIDANKFELSPTEFVFEKTLQRVTDVISFRVDEKRQKFSVRIDKAIPTTLIADDQRLAQVVTNLLGNAVKFTPEGGSITLGANFIKEEDGICTIQIEVTDTGIGVTEEQKSRLFMSFEQAESGTSRRFGGTGLGLAISKRIVEMMGGRIFVESEPGKGSKFAFTVRVARGARERASLLAPGVNWKNIRVMAVDDEDDVREFFAEIARRMGFACDVAGDAAEALALIERNGAYDIYFIDWKMPGMNGIELTREIKRRESDDSVVILISSSDWNAIAEEGKSVGVNRYLSKPIFPSSIADLLNECLGAHDASGDDRADTDAFGGRCVLLVEDVEVNREIVLSLLEPTKLEIDCAENGVEAVRMFTASPEKYDMIFMDVQMPEMDGYEATRQIRALGFPKAGTTPIIAMTANVFREDVEKCLAAGMNGHVGKPLNFNDVLEKLREYLTETP
jgi:signal transduction histidine kinase/DNA-binding response OmpR family regulator